MSQLDKFERWQKNLQRVRLPHWRQLPKMDLYIDQVATLVNESLTALGMEPLTKSMINNYVKKRVIVAPVKKKYATNQVADLMVIGLCKGCFSLPEIKQGIAQVTINAYPQRVYDRFVDVFNAQLAGKDLTADPELPTATDRLLSLTCATLVNRLTASKLMSLMREETKPQSVDD